MKACAASLATISHAASLNLFQPIEIAAGTYLLASTIPGEAQVGVIVGARSVAIIGAPKSGVHARRIVQHVAELTDKPISHVIVLSQFCDHACGSAELSETRPSLPAMSSIRSARPVGLARWMKDPSTTPAPASPRRRLRSAQRSASTSAGERWLSEEWIRRSTSARSSPMSPTS
jgi:hypothetical protein